MIHTLTSLRFIFALMVFCTHCYIIDDFFAADFFKEGFVGVSFFFVLSGFIISYNYQKKLADQTTTKRSFWIARFARVYPLHWLTLFLSLALGGYVLSSGALDWGKHFLASLTLTHAYIPRADYFFSFNSPSWSLCCEQLFYVCFPFLAISFKSNKKLGIGFLLLAFFTLWGMSLTPEENIKGYWYVNPITRFPDFVLGMILFRIYIYFINKKITFKSGTFFEILSVVVFLFFYLYAPGIPKVYRYSCYYWLPVSFVLLSFSLQKGALSKLLSNRFLLIGGEISYSFYLIHLLVLSSFVEWQKHAQWEISWQLSVPLLFCLITGLSLLSFYYFEKPVNKLIKKTFKRLPVHRPSY